MEGLFGAAFGLVVLGFGGGLSWVLGGFWWVVLGWCDMILSLDFVVLRVRAVGGVWFCGLDFGWLGLFWVCGFSEQGAVVLSGFVGFGLTYLFAGFLCSFCSAAFLRFCGFCFVLTWL